MSMLQRRAPTPLGVGYSTIPARLRASTAPAKETDEQREARLRAWESDLAARETVNPGKIV